MVIGRLRQASEGVKEKPLCWHLLLCQHLPSCSYSISPFVRPSTKVSPMRHASSELGSYCVTARHSSVRVACRATNGNSFTWFLSTNSTCFYIYLHMFLSKEQSKNKQRTKKNSSHSIMELSFRFMFSLLHDLTINQ